MRAYILMSGVINEEIWLYDLGGVDVSHNSDTLFEQLDGGYTTECILRMIFFTWCIFKLYCRVNLCITSSSSSSSFGPSSVTL